MATLLIFLLSLGQLQVFTNSEILDATTFEVKGNDDLADLFITPPEVNSIEHEVQQDDTDTAEAMRQPVIRTGMEQTELDFQYPISSVSIDYAKNMIILKFRRDQMKQRMQLSTEEQEKRKAFEQNFMRFGRAAASDFMRFGKRESEQLPPFISKNAERDFYKVLPSGELARRSYEAGTMRDSRGDNFMRFGRSAAQDFMRFGRASGDFMRFGRSPADFMRLGRTGHTNDFMRLGRNPNFMRFGRGGPDDFMRFGRTAKQDFMRLGRTAKSQGKNFMRFGRPDNFMRFGRAPPEPTTNQANFMRFGKSSENKISASPRNKNTSAIASQGNDIQQQENQQQQQQQRQQQAQQQSDQLQQLQDDNNPNDQAIQVLFSKQQPDQMTKTQTDGLQTVKNDELDADSEYDFN